MQVAEGAARVAPQLQVGEGIGDGSSTRSDQMVISSRGAMMPPGEMRPALLRFPEVCFAVPTEENLFRNQGQLLRTAYPPTSRRTSCRPREGLWPHRSVRCPAARRYR